MPDFAVGIRVGTCQRCVPPCEAWQQRAIAHDQPDAACPAGLWGKYSASAAPAADSERPAAVRPSLWDKAKNLTEAFMRWQAAGRPRRSNKQVKACLSVCRSCDVYNPKGNFHLGECRHPQCGCTDFKPRWATETCPLGKWPA